MLAAARATRCRRDCPWPIWANRRAQAPIRLRRVVAFDAGPATARIPMHTRERALYVVLSALLLALVVITPTATMLGSGGLGLCTWVKGLLDK
jgi:hypothetical protein